MSYKILFSDIDGTLLDADRTLSQKTIKVLSELKNRFPIVLISSRMPVQMYYLQEKAGILGMPLIAYNGALVLDKGGEVLHSVEIPHTLCEQGSEDLETTLKAVEAQFGPYLHQVKWLNMGGGHHITREGYDVDLLISEIKRIRETYNLEIYIEPGEAIALNAGYLATEVLDIVENGIEILVLDASATCHMPDVLEMPYRPPLRNGFEAQEKAHTYRLSSNTCLTGDVIGDYSFENPVQIGDRLYFEDMAIYSFVKNNTFNGIGLPSLYLMDEQGECNLVKSFGYQDFKGRLS